MDRASLFIQNDGPAVASCNWWETEMEQAGLFYVSINAGAFRLFVPRISESVLADMTTARIVVVSRGPWRQSGLADAMEILFDDGSDSPYAIHLQVQAFDRLPLDADARKELQFTVWTAPTDGQPQCAAEFPARYRRVKTLPCLKRYEECR